MATACSLAFRVFVVVSAVVIARSGVEAQIDANFSKGAGTDTAAPTPPLYNSSCSQELNVFLVLDKSGSLSSNKGCKGCWQELTAFVGSFVSGLYALKATDLKLSIALFDDRTDFLLPLTGDRAAIEAAQEALRMKIPGGNTDPTGALAWAVRQIERKAAPRSRSAIVILTDGVFPDVEEDAALMAQAVSNDAKIFTIGVGNVKPKQLKLLSGSNDAVWRVDNFGALSNILSELTASVLGCIEILPPAATCLYRAPELLFTGPSLQILRGTEGSLPQMWCSLEKGGGGPLVVKAALNPDNQSLACQPPDDWWAAVEVGTSRLSVNLSFADTPTFNRTILRSTTSVKTVPCVHATIPPMAVTCLPQYTLEGPWSDNTTLGSLNLSGASLEANPSLSLECQFQSRFSDFAVVEMVENFSCPVPSVIRRLSHLSGNTVTLRVVAPLLNISVLEVALDVPTPLCTENPTEMPTAYPTVAEVSATPNPTTGSPTDLPTTAEPTRAPTKRPTTVRLTGAPTAVQPTGTPVTVQPTIAPSVAEVPTDAVMTICPGAAFVTVPSSLTPFNATTTCKFYYNVPDVNGSYHTTPMLPVNSSHVQCVIPPLLHATLVYSKNGTIDESAVAIRLVVGHDSDESGAAGFLLTFLDGPGCISHSVLNPPCSGNLRATQGGGAHISLVLPNATTSESFPATAALRHSVSAPSLRVAVDGGASRRRLRQLEERISQEEKFICCFFIAEGGNTGSEGCPCISDKLSTKTCTTSHATAGESLPQGSSGVPLRCHFPSNMTSSPSSANSSDVGNLVNFFLIREFHTDEVGTRRSVVLRTAVSVPEPPESCKTSTTDLHGIALLGTGSLLVFVFGGLAWFATVAHRSAPKLTLPEELQVSEPVTDLVLSGEDGGDPGQAIGAQNYIQNGKPMPVKWGRYGEIRTGERNLNEQPGSDAPIAPNPEIPAAASDDSAVTAMKLVARAFCVVAVVGSLLLVAAIGIIAHENAG